MKYIDTIVHKLTAQYQTREPFELCEKMDILTYFAPLPASIRGFYFSTGGRQMICVGDELPTRQQKIVCAHELGHAILHPALDMVFMKAETQLAVEKYEKEADYFCVSLLLNANMVEEARMMEGGFTVEGLSRLSGLPEKAVRLKFYCQNV